MIRIIKDRDALRKVEISGSVVTLKLPTKGEFEQLRAKHTTAAPVGGQPTLQPEYFAELEKLAVKNIEPFGDENGDRAFTQDDLSSLDEIIEGAILRFLGSPADELNRRVKDKDGVYREPTIEVMAAAVAASAGLPDESAEKKGSGDGSAPG